MIKALERTQQLTVAKDVFNLVYGQVGDYLLKYIP